MNNKKELLKSIEAVLNTPFMKKNLIEGVIAEEKEEDFMQLLNEYKDMSDIEKDDWFID